MQEGMQAEPADVVPEIWGWQAGTDRDGQTGRAGQAVRAAAGPGRAGQPRALTVLEVEAVEVHALHQVAQRFGLEGGEPRVADLPAKCCVSLSPTPPPGPPPPPRPHSRVGLEVPVVDGLDELLCDLNDLLLAGCGDSGVTAMAPGGGGQRGRGQTDTKSTGGTHRPRGQTDP